MFPLTRAITSDIVVRFRVGFDAQFHRLSIKQLVHAFSCALSSYGALGTFGEHSRHFFRALQISRVLHNSIVHAKV